MYRYESERDVATRRFKRSKVLVTISVVDGEPKEVFAHVGNFIQFGLEPVGPRQWTATGQGTSTFLPMSEEQLHFTWILNVGKIEIPPDYSTMTIRKSNEEWLFNLVSIINDPGILGLYKP